MKLKSGRTFWPTVNPGRGTYAPLHQDLVCDVAIVGGGVIGALLAYHLSAEGFSIVLVDKRRLGGGSTSASTALLLYELDVHLTDLVQLLGPRAATRVYELSLRSIDTLRRLTTKLGIGDCYRRKKSLYVGFRPRDVETLEAEYRARKRRGVRCELLTRATLKRRFGLEAHAAILSHQAAEVDPYRLTRALLQKSAARGVRCFERTEVLRHRESRDESTLETARHTIRARRVVMATGYESQSYLRKKVVTLKSSYVIVSAPMPELRAHWLWEHLFWETARPYLYVRTTQDGRVVVGGEDVATPDERRRDALLPTKSRRLKARFRALFPTLPFRIAFAWAGTFGETRDGMGYVGVPAGWKRTQFVLGFGGNGITFGVTAAEIVAARLLRRPHAVGRVFAFDRHPSGRGPCVGLRRAPLPSLGDPGARRTAPSPGRRGPTEVDPATRGPSARTEAARRTSPVTP